MVWGGGEDLEEVLHAVQGARSKKEVGSRKSVTGLQGLRSRRDTMSRASVLARSKMNVSIEPAERLENAQAW